MFMKMGQYASAGPFQPVDVVNSGNQKQAAACPRRLAAGCRVFPPGGPAADGGAKSLAMLEEVLGGTIESFGGLENAIMTGLNVNAGATFKAINASLGQMENSVQQNQLAVKMYGAVGAKALVTLALNADELDKQVNLSNAAFEKGVAIQEAYATIASSK